MVNSIRNNINSAEDFTTQILSAQKNKLELEAMVKRAKSFVLAEFDYKSVAKTFIKNLKLIPSRN